MVFIGFGEQSFVWTGFQVLGDKMNKGILSIILRRT